jgi:hypothetical protein
MDELPARKVRLCDPFWSPRLEVNARRAIFHQWGQLEASGCIDNFRIAAGEKDGFREGWFFADSDAHKWLDAAACIYATHPDPEPAPSEDEELAALMDDFIALLGRAQTPDGYLFTYNQIHFPGDRWVNLQIEHELYCHGHLIEAGVSHYEATGRSDMLSIVRRAADLLVRDFLGAGPQRTPGHEEVEIALIRLYRVTGHAPYLDLARHFLKQRGHMPFFALSLLRQGIRASGRAKLIRQQRQAYLAAHPEWAAFQLPADNIAKRPPASTLRWNLNALAGKYAQQHAPIRKQTVPVGHAVRFGYLETAVSMLHRDQPDETLLPAMKQAWERMVARRMYITGGLGSLPDIEGFGHDYELDPEYAYAETCAALASLLWNWEMSLITGEAKYSDLFEWQLYNAAAAGMGLSGESYLYNNPLACRGGVTRKAWYAVPCCPSNLSRTWAGLGKYVYSTEKDNLYIHQYLGSRASLDIGLPVDVELESGLPWAGRVTIRLELAYPAEFTVHLRIPSWSADRADVRVNGEAVAILPVERQPAAASGYDPRLAQSVSIHRLWSPGDVIALQFDLSITLRRAHPKVKGHSGKVAVTRGLLVYCLESVDNPDVDIFTCRLEPSSLRTEFDAQLLGGICLLRGYTADGQPLAFIPYQLWANRGESQMSVWINTN